MKKHAIARLARELSPPFFVKIYKKINNVGFPKFSAKWWGKNRSLYPHELQELISSYVLSSDFSKTSEYWLYLLRQNLEQIKQGGVENYGTSVARNYYTWTDFDDNRINNLVPEKSANPEVSLDIFKTHRGFTKSESLKHNVLIQLMYLFLQKASLLDQLHSLSDSGFVFGRHPFLDSKHGKLTSDKLASLIELQNFQPVLSRYATPRILEIGAGSGRTANALMCLNANLKYVIADIPPATYIATQRLRAAFPLIKIKVAKNQAHLSQLIQNEDDWDVLVLLPSLLEYIPDKYFGLMLAIDCLHEMKEEARIMFSDVANKKSEHYFFKIWNDTHIPLDGVYLTKTNLSDYGVKDNWKCITSSASVFPSDFSEFLFQID